ncbi:putative Histidine kinase [Rhodospirillaceae bacterium LM-1]|nr:putative Histidine kinase [Rhodospirillaceae bacterium LM-1]
MPGFKHSLQRLVVSFGPIRTATTMGVLVLSSILFSISNVERHERQSFEEAKRQAASYAAAFAEYGELAIFGADQVLQTGIARFGETQTPSREALLDVEDWMRSKLSESSIVAGLSVVDARGYLLKEMPSAKGSQDRRLSPGFRFHKDSTDGRLQFWGRVYNPAMSRETIEISRRIASPSGDFLGVVSASIDTSSFSSFFKNAYLPEGSAIGLFAADGRLLLRFPHANDDIRPPTHKSQVSPQEGGGKRIEAAQDFFRYPLQVRVELPSTPIMRQSQALGLSYTGFILVLTLMAVLIVTLVRTLSKRLMAEEQIRVLSRAVENSPMSVIITDAKGRIEYVNPFFTNLTGFSQEEAIGQNPNLLKSGNMASEDYERMWTTISSGQIWHGEFHNLRKDGTSYWELAAIAPIKDESGQIGHFVAVKEDISLRKKAEQELLAAKEMAEEANRAKSAFLANMSHELRTPLNAVLGFADMLKEGIYGPLNDRQQEALQDIHRGGTHLLDIINDVLDMSRIEAGRYEISENDVDLKSIIQDCVKMVQPRAQRNAVAITRQVPEHLANVWGDERAVRQIVLNLLSNAVKFSQRRGHVSISAGGDTQGGVWISVADDGPGISSSDLDRLFQPFQQGEQWLTRQHEGTGLGLAISKRLMELHGGTIHLESTLGQGTTVWLHFPASRTHANAA